MRVIDTIRVKRVQEKKAYINLHEASFPQSSAKLILVEFKSVLEL
jgi:hypothetical protein